MLTEAVFAPASIPLAPKATQAIPSANKLIPIPYFKFAEGLYLLSHHLENNGANEIIADKKKQLETLEQYKKSVIYEYVTGKKEIPA